MERTLGNLLKIKGSKTPTDFQLKHFGLTREKITSGWYKRYKNLEVNEEAWESLLETVKTVSPQKARRTDEQSVYVLKNFWGHYKIGIAKDVYRRAKDITVGNSEPLEIIYVFEVDRASKQEQILHLRYKDHHKRGEWFDENLDVSELADYMDKKGMTIKYNSTTEGRWLIS